MVKKIILVLLCIVGLLVLISVLQIILPGKKVDSLVGYKTTSAQLGTKKYTLYVADTKQKQAQGLSGVKNLEENEGMLFDFKKSGTYYFWMKDMLFPLDFVFIRDGTIVDIISHVDPKDYPKIYTAIVPFDAVIELNSGATEVSEIKIGEKVIYTR